VLRRRNNSLDHTGGVAGIIGRNPRETVGLFAALAAILFIFANALFLQSGPHPAPFFTARPLVTSGATAPVPLPLPAPVLDAMTMSHMPAINDVQRSKAPVRTVAVESRHSDPIAQLLGASKQVLAVQRVLTAYGYGQIRPTGTLGPETQDAIKKFERSRKMPVTGTISDQLVRALAEMSGQSLD